MTPTKILIFTISATNENATLIPARPLYDVLPSPTAGPSDFTLSASSPSVSVPHGKNATARITVMPRGGFDRGVNLTVAGVPRGVTASFSPANTAGSSTLTVTAERAAIPATLTLTITGNAGAASHSLTLALAVTPVMTGTVAVDFSSAYNVNGIYDDGSRFSQESSLDGDGFAFSEQLLGHEQVGDGVVFHIGPPNVPDIVTGKTVALPPAKFSTPKVLALGVNGDQELQTFTVTYADETSSSFTQSLSDWAAPRNFVGESVAFGLPYRLVADGSRDARTFYGYAYSFNLDSHKVVRSLTLPSNRDVLIFSATLLPQKE